MPYGLLALLRDRSRALAPFREFGTSRYFGHFTSGASGAKL